MLSEIQGVELYVFHSGHGVGNNSFIDLIDFGTFSLVRLFRNLTPPLGGCWPLFALGLDRIKRYGCRCSWQMLNTTARVYLALFVYVLTYIFYQGRQGIRHPEPSLEQAAAGLQSSEGTLNNIIVLGRGLKAPVSDKV